MSKDTIKISGMTCAACARRIEKAVGRLEGVTSAVVNFAAEQLSVEYGQSETPMEKIKEKHRKKRVTALSNNPVQKA